MSHGVDGAVLAWWNDTTVIRRRMSFRLFRLYATSRVTSFSRQFLLQTLSPVDRRKSASRLQSYIVLASEHPVG